MTAIRLAVVQRPPVLLDRAATPAVATTSPREAAAAGAQLLVVPEAYLPGYPVWMWRLRPGNDYNLTSDIHERLLANSVDLEAGGLQPLQDVAGELGVVVVCGIHERDSEFSRG